MRLYGIVSAIHIGYPLAVFWCYVAAFFLALSLMFVFPPGTIILLWLALVGLVVVVIVHRLLGLARHTVARIILNAGSCPSCGQRADRVRDGAQPWTCLKCGHGFAPSGADLGQDEDADEAA
jgi:hypothetical protein